MLQTPHDVIETVGELRAFLKECGGSGLVETRGVALPCGTQLPLDFDDTDCLCAVEVGTTLARASIPYRYDPGASFEYATDYDPTADRQQP